MCNLVAKKMNGNCWWSNRQTVVDRLTGSSKVICPPFFEGRHNKDLKMH
jgi:hypothetical protein